MGVSDPTDLSAAQYTGLADLYMTDERYTNIDGTPDLAFAAFMRQSMLYFASQKLSK